MKLDQFVKDLHLEAEKWAAKERKGKKPPQLDQPEGVWWERLIEHLVAQKKKPQP